MNEKDLQNLRNNFLYELIPILEVLFAVDSDLPSFNIYK